MTNPELCSDLWSIRKITNSGFDREYWHFDDLVDYTSETTDRDNDEESMNWKEDSSTRRSRGTNDSWEQYRYYEGSIFSSQVSDILSFISGKRSSRNDDDYLNERYRRDRYDRDNEPFDRRMGGANSLNY